MYPNHTYRVHGRVRVDLQREDIFASVLEKTVIGVKHLVREQVKPFSG